MNIPYLYFTFSAIFNAAVGTFLAIFIYFKDTHSKVNKTLALFSIGVAIWSYAYLFWPLSKTAEETLFYFQMLHIGACFVSIFYLKFVITWLDLYQSKKKILFFGYVSSTFFALSVFSPYFIAGMEPKFSMLFWAKPGILYHFYLINFFGFYLYSCHLLFKHLKQSSGIKQRQIRLILVGIGLSFLGGSTNYPLWYNINFPPYGNILASSYVILTVYAIVRYNLLNIKLIATEATVLLLNLFFVFRLVISNTIWEGLTNGLVLVVSLILSFILVRSVKKEIYRRQEMEKLKQELEIAYGKLKVIDEAKTDFLSMASHQLRSPLTVVRLGIGALLDGTFGDLTDKRQIDALNKMLESSTRLINLIGEYLNVSRIELGKMKYNFKEQNLCALIKEIVEEYQPRAKAKKLRLIFTKKGAVPDIKFDEEKLRHVIVNLIDNAIKYTMKGVVTVSCELRNKDQYSSVQISVKDTGLGLEAEEIPILFQKFRRASSSTRRRREGEPVEGSGLGLHVAKMFVEKHGGRIWAESDGIGKGSRFMFTLSLLGPPQLPPDEMGEGGKGVELPR